MKIKFIKITLFLAMFFTVFVSCSSNEDAEVETEPDVTDDAITELPAAFAAFNSDAVTVTLSDDGTEIYLETTGYPNHTSIYWETDHELYLDESDYVTKTTENTYIGGGTGEASSFTVDSTPNLNGATVDTELNTIGIAVSGAAIFNDQEGMGDLDQAAGSLDYNGAHKGPGVYHYHLEPRSISNDDDELVGILMDGIFLYGRKDYPSNDYPTDLDASGGHFGPTPYNEDGEYHYHIINEEYNAPLYGYDEAVVLFAGPFQGY
ncbi:YHYH protein [Polaribacter vadi]|uniref:YHYH protein n=1 Tax=Polaribacter TaxID=52959 RepID=UPI001C0A0338|nr:MULTISPECIES: YHYH protein [Polaribacter]MBU3009958.1 YHYH protein [Polaribacter vadi]MDO6739764.1 YHYH protein [Polaribacter sp. 1_MG-2023]